MSRHHPNLPRPRPRRIVAGLFVAIVVAGSLPGLATAQDDHRPPRTSSASGNCSSTAMPVASCAWCHPASASRRCPSAARSRARPLAASFEATYTLAKDTFLIDSPAVETRGCDEASQAIDEAFYQGLADTRKWSTRSSILTLRDEVDDVVMTLTRAKLPADPTIARWDLARLGAADGSIAPDHPGRASPGWSSCAAGAWSAAPAAVRSWAPTPPTTAPWPSVTWTHA